jgi:hypothetical protein
VEEAVRVLWWVMAVVLGVLLLFFAVQSFRRGFRFLFVFSKKRKERKRG